MNAKVGSQEIPGVTHKFGIAVQNEVGQRLIEFCQENDQPRQHIEKQRHYFAKKGVLFIIGDWNAKVGSNR